MFNIVLVQPEIPPNTGNVARLCAATGARLHLIGRLGFRLDDKALKRAGLDDWPAVDVVQYATFEEFEEVRASIPIAMGARSGPLTWAVDTPSDLFYTSAAYCAGDCLLFGNESGGLPPGIRERFAGRVLGIPMPTGKVRSLNLATTVGVVVYEALRQVHGW